MRLMVRVALGFTLLSFNFALQAAGPAAERFEGFTAPIRSIDVAAAESGRITRVHVVRGSRVREGELMVVLDTSVLEASRTVAEARTENSAEIEALTIEYETRRDRHAKLSRLHSEGAVSIEEVTRAKADMDVSRLNVEAAEHERQLSRLQLAEIDARIERRRIRSPINGIVTDVVRDVGEFVSGTAPEVGTVVNLETLRVTFYVTTEFAATLTENQTVGLRVPAMKERVSAKVEFVSPVTQADSGRVRVDVLVGNTRHRLRSGVRCYLDREGLAWHATTASRTENTRTKTR